MSTGARETGAGSSPTSATLAGWVHQLADIDIDAADAELIDRITQLERLKTACAAAQATLTVAVSDSQTAAPPDAKAKDQARHSVAAQIALARHESPVRGGQHLGLARTLLHDMPRLHAAMRAGDVSEWRATLVVRETVCLSEEHRRTVDTELDGQLAGIGDRRVAQAAARIAYRLDPDHYLARNRRAENDRRVSIRPAPDTMSYLTALLPVAQGVAAYAALTRHADTATATGDPRSRGNLMADELVTRITNPTTTHGGVEAGAIARPFEPAADQAARQVTARPSDEATDRSTGIAAGQVTGQATGRPADNAAANAANTADTASGRPAARTTVSNDPDAVSDRAPAGCLPRGINLDLQLVMTDRALFDGDPEPAIITGYGPIPAALARRLVLEAGPEVKTWVRRLYADPDTGELITADARRRTFPHAARQFLITRDQTCRTVWCDAPIRHADHITAHRNGGPTTLVNGQGFCENCNYVKESAGWTQQRNAGAGVTTTTPTGHTTRSNPPPAPRSQPWADFISIEHKLAGLILEVL